MSVWDSYDNWLSTQPEPVYCATHGEDCEHEPMDECPDFYPDDEPDDSWFDTRDDDDYYED